MILLVQKTTLHISPQIVVQIEKAIRKCCEPVPGEVDHLQVGGAVEDTRVEVGKKIVVKGEVVQAWQLVELVRVERVQPAPGHHQVGQLGQRGERGRLQGEASKSL